MVEVVSSKGVEYLEEDDDDDTDDNNNNNNKNNNKSHDSDTGGPSDNNPNNKSNANDDTPSNDDDRKQHPIEDQTSHNNQSLVSSKHDSSSKKKKDRDVDEREGYKGNLYLVLEYVDHDLTGLMDVAYKFTEIQVKSIFKQLLEALQYMHDNKYVHRDIKSSNILIDHHFRVKLADFGLARCIEPALLDRLHEYVFFFSLHKHHNPINFFLSFLAFIFLFFRLFRAPFK